MDGLRPEPIASPAQLPDDLLRFQPASRAGFQSGGVMGFVLLAIFSFTLAPALLCGALSAVLGDAAIGKKRRLRHALLGLAVLALLLVVLACVLAALYPPTEKFPPGSRPLREFMQGAAEIITGLIPFWLALTWTMARPRPEDSRALRFMRGMVLVLVLLPLGFMVSIFWVAIWPGRVFKLGRNRPCLQGGPAMCDRVIAVLAAPTLPALQSCIFALQPPHQASQISRSGLT